MRIVIRCDSPVSHGAFGESAGNAVLCRRVRVVGHPDRPRVPCVSGNALRGVLRRLVMRDLLLHRAQLDPESLPGRQWDRLYAALANGGHLVGAAEKRVVPDRIRQLRRDLPPLSVFGAALYSWILPGHMSVGFLWPRCRETAVARLVSAECDIPAEDLVDEITHCRHVDREWQDPEQSGVTPMPTTMECLLPGTVLEGRILFAPHASSIERGAIVHGLQLLQSIGGKQAAGLGWVTVIEGASQGAAPYHEWLDETDDLADRLVGLAGELA